MPYPRPAKAPSRHPRGTLLHAKAPSRRVGGTLLHAKAVFQWLGGLSPGAGISVDREGLIVDGLINHR